MKFVSTLLAALIGSAAAAPAIIWSAGSEAGVKHSSDVIDASTVLSSVTPSSEVSSASVVFVVERDEQGSEGLTGLTSSGSLPKVANKFSDASNMHHYVRGIESISSLVNDAKASMDSNSVIHTSLADFDRSEGKGSELYVVNVPAASNPADVDAAVASAIDDAKVGSVVLTAVRGISEVKLERDVNKRKLYNEAVSAASQKRKAHGRRLEDNNNNNDNGDSSAVYYVNFTPNIFSGLLFFMFFGVTTYVGIGCMGQIQGQDVYVKKYPTIGREA